MFLECFPKFGAEKNAGETCGRGGFDIRTTTKYYTYEHTTMIQCTNEETRRCATYLAKHQTASDRKYNTEFTEHTGLQPS